MKFILCVLLCSSPIFSEVISQTLTAPCSQIDLNNRDVDGMPFCPDIVKQTDAYSVFRCALLQANSFHTPTAGEKGSMRSLLEAFSQSKTDGIKPITTKAMLSHADELNLQACRVSQERQKINDSFLLFYTKPGIKDYSGPFLMLRETKSSRVLLIGPHDDSDGTYADTKIAIADSFALGLVSNGHIRHNVGCHANGETGHCIDDFVHSTNNLGTFTVSALGNLYQGYVWLHIHGMSNPDHVLYRSRSKALGNVYEKAIVANTNIKPDAFGNLNADFTVDSQVNTNWYLKTEIPARIHVNNKQALAGVVKEIENETWAWDGVAPAGDAQN